MKKERRTNSRLYLNALLLAYELEDTNEYPFDLECFKDNRFDVKKVSVDSWGNAFFYESFNDGKDYVLFSKGKDGIPFTDDDVHHEKIIFSDYY